MSLEKNEILKHPDIHSVVQEKDEPVDKKESILSEDQLDLGLKVSGWSTFVNIVVRLRRSLKVSPFMLAFKSFWFWLNTGIITSLWYFLGQYKNLLEVGKGVLFLPGLNSDLVSAKILSVQELKYTTYVLIAGIIVHAIFSIVNVIYASRGRERMIEYIYVFDTIVLLLFAKTILSPIILLQ